MPNREYIISGLESFLCNVKAKKSCEINGIMFSADDVESIVAMLKAHEPLSVLQKELSCTSGQVGYCPKCGAVLLENYYNPSYCGVCGQAVKWE